MRVSDGGDGKKMISVLIEDGYTRGRLSSLFADAPFTPNPKDLDEVCTFYGVFHYPHGLMKESAVSEL